VLRLPGTQERLIPSNKTPWRFAGGLRKAEIDLRHLGTSKAAGIFDVEVYE
jgi:hypothetical protein